MAAYRRVYDSRHLQADCKNRLLFSFHGSRRQRTSPADLLHFTSSWSCLRSPLRARSGRGKGKRSIAVSNQPHRYGNSRAIWDHTYGRGYIPALTSAEAGTRLSDSGGMQGNGNRILSSGTYRKTRTPLPRFIVDSSNCCVFNKSTKNRGRAY